MYIDPYFEKDITCDLSYKCDGCEVRDTVGLLIKKIMLNQNNNKEVDNEIWIEYVTVVWRQSTRSRMMILASRYARTVLDQNLNTKESTNLNNQTKN